jgi:hypothetical protein
MKRIPPPGQIIRPDEPLSDYISQNGVRPGPRKLIQFQTALRIRGAPPLYSQEGKGDEAVVYVKMFNPAGSGTWLLLEWDGTDEAFSFCTGTQFDEYGYLSLKEMAFLPGPLGIGIEIDTGFRPKTLKEAKK